MLWDDVALFCTSVFISIFGVMERFFKHFKGGLYRLVGFAKDSETQEQMVVYQALYGEKQRWIRPAEMFFGKVDRDGKQIDRFEEIDEGAIPPASNPKYHFPDIEYIRQKPPISKGGFSKEVKGMITLLQERQIVGTDCFQGLKCDDDLEEEALRRIYEYNENCDLEGIFHLIQTWGGITGRGVYVRGKGFCWSDIEPAYLKLIDACLSTRRVNDLSISNLVSAVERFNKEVCYLGVSFITKHTRFWLHKSLGAFNALPIYDRIMATKLMGKEEARIADLAEYWRVMHEKHRLLQVGLVSLERQIFLYYSRPKKTYKGFTFKYYRGEKHNPFEGTDDNAAMWWDGERLFYDSISREDGDSFIETMKEWYEDALTHDDLSDIHRNWSISRKDHVLLFYLDLWHGKWFPYDNRDVITQY